MLNWAEYRKEPLGHIGEIGQITPDTVKGYKTLPAATTGSLDAKTHEPTMLAVVVTTRCNGCITVHTTEVIKHGAMHEETTNALSVAIPLSVGTALVHSVRVLDTV